MRMATTMPPDPDQPTGAAMAPQASTLAAFVNFSRALLECANRGPSRIEFLPEATRLLFDITQCDRLELRARSGPVCYRWRADAARPRDGILELLCADASLVVSTPQGDLQALALERLAGDILAGCVDRALPGCTPHGSFWTVDIRHLPAAYGAPPCPPRGSHSGALAMIPFVVDEHTAGLMRLEYDGANTLSAGSVESYEAVAQTLGLAIAHRRAQAALRERVKELTCLYGMTRVTEEAELTIAEALERIVQLLPPAWQFPAQAVARITLDGREFRSAGWSEPEGSQREPIEVHDLPRGFVEVGYRVNPASPEELFLPDELSLIRAVAAELSLFIERRESVHHRVRLEEQLRQVDRLATIGKLAAGLAHELNEPLGAILGFAQLAAKAPDVGDAPRADLEKIVKAALHARDIVKQLQLFARQSPPQVKAVALNELVEESLAMLAPRLAEKNVALTCDLAADLPTLWADPVQIQQILVNLVVNALQALGESGTIRVTTRTAATGLVLSVEDTGQGMTADVRRRMFDPFFTTKDVGEGLGLGLSVVHGIVSAHGGTIQVFSEPDRGSRFEVLLPLKAIRFKESVSGADYGE